MDTIIRNAIIAGREEEGPLDIGIADGRIAAIEAGLSAVLSGEGEELDVGGRLVSPGLIETHIHLDKTRIMERCGDDLSSPQEAMKRVAEIKSAFTAEDVYQRGRQTLERCILNGTTHMRTHVEVDPAVGLRGFEGVKALAEDYRWAIDVEICVFPQEGLTNYPGTEELMIEALRNGAAVVGAAPGFDTDRKGQIDRVFALAREFDVDMDLHLDFADGPEDADLDYVCQCTEAQGWGGRVAIGHVTRLAAMTPDTFAEKARRMAGAGVALTVLPATDLFLMGRNKAYDTPRGVVPAHKLLKLGVNCSLSTNNVLNPFTPYGDGSLIRMANLYANICYAASREELQECFEMLTRRSARLMRIEEYGLDVGAPADLVVLDCAHRKDAVAELAAPLHGFKRGRRTFTRAPASLHPP